MTTLKTILINGLVNAESMIGTADEWCRYFATKHIDPVVTTTHLIDWPTFAMIVSKVVAKLVTR